MMQGFTLALDGSTYSGSVAVIRHGEVVSARELPAAETPGRSGRDENFMPMVAAAIADAGLRPSEIDRIVCGAGPGSFTSLRIAASIAKGFAVGLGRPLFAVSSLVLMVAERSSGRYLATLPAMRGEVFALIVDVDGNGSFHAGSPVLAPETSIDAFAHSQAAVRIAERPHARAVRAIMEAVVATGPCDIDSWEPAYGRLAEAQVKWEATHGRPLPPTA